MGIVVKNLTKKYGTKTVVDDLSFEMKEPGVYALLGTNGAGKTTTIRMMLGMLDKDFGEALWDDKPINFDNCNIGYLAEERGLYPKYTLLDQIRYFGELRGVTGADLDKKIRYWAEKLKLVEYIYPDEFKDERDDENQEFVGLNEGNKKPAFRLGTRKPVRKKKKPLNPDQLSKGNQQKIQFLIGMLSDPDLLVLDEPFSGLDPVNTDILKEVIREQIKAGKYIIMSSHQMEVVEEFCTNITILNRSKAVVQGNLNEIKKSYGRVNLLLKTEEDVSQILKNKKANVITEKEGEYHIKVSGDNEAQDLLKEIINAGITVVRFELSELTLHEIFVKEVGQE
ncbi:MAG: ATP-binding cassette domain-containing protein [Eubacterium sp.]|nr:ATP-binding cassette domain-containing protein [Eubacterium sp.]